MLYPLSRLRVAIVVLVLLFTDSPFAHAAQRPATPAEEPGHAKAAEAQVLVTNEQDARETRTDFENVLKRLPPTVGRVMRMDPSLMRNQTYLAPYPTLAAFLQAHPAVVQNPGYYLEHIEYRVLESARASGCAHAGAAHVGRDVPGARDLRRHLDHRDGGTLAVEDHDRTPALVSDVQSADRSAHEAARSVHLERRSHGLHADAVGTPVPRVRSAARRGSFEDGDRSPIANPLVAAGRHRARHRRASERSSSADASSRKSHSRSSLSVCSCSRSAPGSSSRPARRSSSRDAWVSSIRRTRRASRQG